ncbi:MAG TPA: transglycosylase SLT domain-containing protein, partial [bacterium]|nr:transglycosylase SLT domain-containing protein [bacterium]
GLGILIAGEATAPKVVHNPAALANPTDVGAYSITALHHRLPPAALEEVQRYLDFFTTKQRRRIQDGLARSGRYQEAFRKIFHEEGIPEELVYLPMIESGFVETAVSPAQAVGVWQFIEETGARYHLQRDSWSDRRLDPIGSARAAAQLLRNLYETFGNWDLALAAYNSGPGTVNWALKVNAKERRPIDYWDLDLPDETKNYVPAFIAMVLIAKNPSAFGFDEIQFHPKLVYDQLKVAPGVPLSELADSLGLDVDQLYELNPELIRGTVPPGNPYVVRIPAGSKARLLAQQHFSPSLSPDYFVYPLKKEDSLQELATHFSTRLASIQRINRIKDDGDLTLKRYLFIPL